MEKKELTKETVSLSLVIILSAVLNIVNLGIEGTANPYYAAAVKSMTKSIKNFFFVSFDPAGFVTIDKPPLGFWFQAISAKIFGYSGWSILLPQALAGVASVIIIYFVVKRSFGSIAGIIASLCLAVTPVFVAVSRNNSVDNVLVFFLLLACWALSLAAERGKLKYLILTMVLVGLGFNVKMLQAYMVVPALYITYLLSTSVSLKKRIINLSVSTVVLMLVSLSWALIVDAVPASSRPYVDSSTNNTVMELITGHNGLERISLSGSQSNNGGPGMGKPPTWGNSNSSKANSNQNGMNGVPPSNVGGPATQGNPSSGNGNNSSGNINSNQMGPFANGQGMPNGMRPNGGFKGFGGSNSSNLQGAFGAQTPAGIGRLFSKNILADQIVWFILLGIIGFIAAAIKEKLSLRLDNNKKQALVLWFMWFLPVFIYFSFNTGTFHSYYLTMLAPPTAALSGIGIVSMWELYKEGTKKAYFLPFALIANGIAQLVMLNYFKASSNIVKFLMAVVIIFCFGASITLILLNILKKKSDEATSKNKIHKAKLGLVALALAGLIATPLVGSGTVLSTKLNGSFPAAGLELLSSQQQKLPGMNNSSTWNRGNDPQKNSNSKLIKFLQKNKTKNQKYLLVVSNSNSAAEIIIKTGEAVMALGGFLGSDKAITLKEFKALVKKGEIRYVMTGGMGGGGNSNNQIMNWVQKSGKLVSSIKYSNISADIQSLNKNTSKATRSNTTSRNRNFGGFRFGNSGQLYDLKAYTNKASAK